MVKRGLGKGLGALIPTEARVDEPGMDAAHPAAGYAEVAIAEVAANPRQPRTVFDPETLAELVFSLQQVGLLQPIVVRPKTTGGYELVAGERRLRAAAEAGWVNIPAIIRHTDDTAMLRDALLENLHRANLNALEEAAAYAQLLTDFGCTQEELATRIGRSRPQVSNTIRLLKLPASVQNRVAAGVLSAGHARALLSLSSEAAMESMARRIVAEGLSVRSVEELILLNADDVPSKPKRSRRTRDSAVGDVVDDLVTRAADALETRATAKGFATSRARGYLLIECADVDDLRRVVDLLD